MLTTIIMIIVTNININCCMCVRSTLSTYAGAVQISEAYYVVVVIVPWVVVQIRLIAWPCSPGPAQAACHWALRVVIGNKVNIFLKVTYQARVSRNNAWWNVEAVDLNMQHIQKEPPDQWQSNHAPNRKRSKIKLKRGLQTSQSHNDTNDLAAHISVNHIPMIQ